MAYKVLDSTNPLQGNKLLTATQTSLIPQATTGWSVTQLVPLQLCKTWCKFTAIVSKIGRRMQVAVQQRGKENYLPGSTSFEKRLCHFFLIFKTYILCIILAEKNYICQVGQCLCRIGKSTVSCEILHFL